MLSLARTLNVFQLMIALLLDWLTITAGPPWPWIVAAPPTTEAPSGPAAASLKPSASSAMTGGSRLRKRGCHRGSLYRPSGEDEKNRVFLRGPVCSSSGTAPV